MVRNPFEILTKKSLLKCLISLLLSPSAYAANLIINPGFENISYRNCVSSYSPFLAANIMGWSGHDPDYFTDCSKSQYQGLNSNGWPVNFFGNQLPRENGNLNTTYVGFRAIWSSPPNHQSYHKHEYLIQKLNESLTPGITYDLEFYYSFAGNNQLFVRSIGALFSESRLDDWNYGMISGVNPQVTANLSTDFITSEGALLRDTWKQVKGELIAKGNEAYLTVGLFNDSTFIEVPGSSYTSDSLGLTNAYLYLDDFSLTCTPKPNLNLFGFQNTQNKTKVFKEIEDIRVDWSQSKNLYDVIFTVQESDSAGSIIPGGLTWSSDQQFKAKGLSPTPLPLGAELSKTGFLPGKWYVVKMSSRCHGNDWVDITELIFVNKVDFKDSSQINCDENFSFDMSHMDPGKVADHYEWYFINLSTNQKELLMKGNGSPLPLLSPLGPQIKEIALTEKNDYLIELIVNFKNIQQTASRSFRVKRLPLIWSGFKETPLLDNEILNLKYDGADPKSLLWEIEDSDGTISIKNQKSISHRWSDRGEFSVSLNAIYPNACVAYDTKKIKVNFDTLFVPNAFTPNGDENNSVFKPAGEDTKIFEIMIYNGYGELVFAEKHDLGVPPSQTYGWNGEYKNQPAKSGVYTYLIFYAKEAVKNQNAIMDKQIMKGTLTLLL